MNPDLKKLLPYPFERLAALKHGIIPPPHLSHIPLSIGEPKHQPPEFVLQTLSQHLDGAGTYPMAKGLPGLRQSISRWLTRRFMLGEASIDPESQVIPVSGTREGLFAFAQAVIDSSSNPLVVMPNPFYQIYEGAAFMAGAQPYYMNTLEANGFLPNLDAIPTAVWKNCQLLYICTPGNPTGSVMDINYLKRLIDLSDQFDFIIASDECYSEIYLDETMPPPSLLKACKDIGRDDFKGCVVFHSLSKRSNIPGLRSGFVAGDADIISKYLLYRTYHGCAVPIPVQYASIAAWDEDQHVTDNRKIYQRKFSCVLQILKPVLDVYLPEAAFYLWPRTPISDEEFARGLFTNQNVTVLPGTYLSRRVSGGDPGENRIRISLVASIDDCIEAARRIRTYVESL